MIENRSDLCTPRSAFKRCVCTNIYKQTTLVTMAITKCIKDKVTRLLMDKYSPKDHLNKQSNKVDPKEKTRCYHEYALIERRIALHRSKAGQAVQRTLRFSIPSRPLINVKSRSHM